MNIIEIDYDLTASEGKPTIKTFLVTRTTKSDYHSGPTDDGPGRKFPIDQAGEIRKRTELHYRVYFVAEGDMYGSTSIINEYVSIIKERLLCDVDELRSRLRNDFLLPGKENNECTS